MVGVAVSDAEELRTYRPDLTGRLTYVIAESCIDAAAWDSQEGRPRSLRIGWTRHRSPAPESPSPGIVAGTAGMQCGSAARHA